MTIDKVISVVVILLGLYMIFAFNGGKLLVPPVISGIALVLLGLPTLIHCKKSD